MRLVFGSCSKIQTVDPQPVWSRIRAERADVVLLLGDNVYLSRNDHDDPEQLAAELRELYARQLAEPNFAALRSDLVARRALLAAIYDDHDFLGDNRYGGDADPGLRDVARRELIRALAPPQSGPEVYSALRIGDVLLLICDVRFYRLAPSQSAEDRDALLGATQWRWLEAQLSATDARFVVVASSSTFHRFRDQSWEQYPGAFGRLRKLIGNRPGALVVSGDIHCNDSYDDTGVVELVSSGVARRGLVYGGLRENYCVVDFDALGASVEFKGLKPRENCKFRLALADWRL